eukprot:TRINITY_DN25494_c0_g1_i1.p1 TRINITY_DN25494_c0_g1~~TRINITY_DN25494_c0_g1_i1.p1  ORF type:complete len:172 (+),score=22.44 TRINITY_DN25494_c0_g1_i1:78-593(+)
MKGSVDEEKIGLQRYVDAQSGMGPGSSYATALVEMCDGEKKGCWIWYIFPQFLDPGRASSTNNQTYQLHSKEEVTAYLKHEVLGARLVEISKAVSRALESAPALRVMGGSVDAKKLHQSVTCFHKAAADAGMESEANLFHRILVQIHSRPYTSGAQFEDLDMVSRWESLST